jgi:hypothetical protein
MFAMSSLFTELPSEIRRLVCLRNTHMPAESKRTKAMLYWWAFYDVFAMTFHFLRVGTKVVELLIL